VASFVRNIQAAYPNPTSLEPLVTVENLQLLEQKILEKCDSRDGVKDGVLDDPRKCDFEVRDLPLCRGEQTAATCVTKAQRQVIERIYSPTSSQRAAVYPGQPFGAEGQPVGWPLWITGRTSSAVPNGRGVSLQYQFATEFFKYFVFGRPDWDYSTYDLSNWRSDTRAVAEILNADNPDLSGFTARGGKLILAHGWADPALNPLTTISYYERVRKLDRNADDHVRLFMMPGVLHCRNGNGPDTVDWYSVIADWVEGGRAPTRVIAQKLGADGQVTNARPLCAYPMRAVYEKGNTTDAASFACR
jgi:feruloyl esterase